MSVEFNECLSELYSSKYSKRASFVNALADLDLPLENLKIVHVTGTNGKGSVSYKIANTLKLSGQKVGLFVSPHIWTPCERISINSELISNEDFIRYFNRVRSKTDDRSLMIFDVYILMGLSYFIDNKCDWIVLEVGVGGRLDSTNFVGNSKLSVITSVGYDHMNILGDTLVDIAFEKAGIIKPNSIAVIGPSCLRYRVFEEKCKEVNAKLIEVHSKNLPFDEENAEIAKRALLDGLGLDPHVAEEGVKTVPPLRLFNIRSDLSGSQVVIDVAHNLHAMENLSRTFCDQYPNSQRYCVYFNSIKRSIDIITPLVDHFESIYLASVVHSKISNNAHLLDKFDEMKEGKLKNKIRSGLSETKQYFIDNSPNYDKIIAHALEETELNSGVLLICGSFFAMADVCEYFNISPSIFGITNPLPDKDINRHVL